MKQVCLLCGRISTDGNLWCQEFDCPAEEKPIVFDYGQHFGDVKILRMLRVAHTAAFYEAQRGDQTVLLKVAHPATASHLKREAEILRRLQTSHFQNHHPVLPHLLPAYRHSNLDRHPYGKAVAAGEERFYEVFQHIEGEFLRDLLIKNPQPWYEHAAWVTLSLANALALLHHEIKRLHLALSPEMILVRTDSEGIPRPVLLDLGLMIKETKPEHLQWLHFHWQPAYTAPELTYTSNENFIECQPATPSSDVYSLAILLYEMFAGRPAHEYQRKRKNQVREAVLGHRPAALMRSDLPPDVHEIVDRAISKLPQDRYENLSDFAAALKRFFGEVPPEKRPKTVLQRVALGAVILVAVVSLVLLLLSLLG